MNYMLISPYDKTNYYLTNLKNNYVYKTELEFLEPKEQTTIYGQFIYSYYNGEHAYFYSENYNNINMLTSSCSIKFVNTPNIMTHKVILYSKESITYQIPNFNLLTYKESTITVEKNINILDVLKRFFFYIEDNRKTFPELYYDKLELETLFSNYYKDAKLILPDDIKSRANIYVSKYLRSFVNSGIILRDDNYFNIFDKLGLSETTYDIDATFPRK